MVALTGSDRNAGASMSDATGASRETSPSPAKMPTMVEMKLLVTEWMQCRSAGTEPR